MLEVLLILVVGFALGYGVRDWISRRRRAAARARRLMKLSPQRK